MTLGLRPADAPTILERCAGDRRLFLRIGALLEQQRSVSETVLAEVAHAPALRTLLLDRRLEKVSAADFSALSSELGCDSIGLTLTSDGEGWLVLALEDELGSSLLSTAPEPEANPDWHTPMTALLPSLAAAVRKPLEGLMAAQADEQRAAALEQLRYVAPPLAVLGELMPLVLADSAAVVRERALALLLASGAHPLVVEVIRLLQKGEDDELIRLSSQLPSDLPETQADLLIAALITVLGQSRVSQGLLEIATRIAPSLARHRGLARFLELVCLGSGRTSLIGCVRALQSHSARAVDAVLHSLQGQSDALDAILIGLLAHPGAEVSPMLLERGVSLLLCATEHPQDRMGLAQALRRLNHAGTLGSILAEQGERLGKSRDATGLWLIAELARNGQLSREQADRLAEALSQVLKAGQGPHLVAILDQELPAVLPASDPLRAALVEPLAELVVRFKDERTADQVERILALIGAPAIDPTWRLIEEHVQARVRCVGAAALPRLIREPQMVSAAITRLLEASQVDDQMSARVAVVEAASRLCEQLEHDPSGLVQAIDRRCEALGASTVVAQARLAAGSLLGADRRVIIVDKLLKLLSAQLPETSAAEERDPATDEITFVLDPQLSAHTDVIPRVLHALRLLTASAQLPAQLYRRIVVTMIETWQAVASWQVIWGPGNVAELARHLGFIAEHERCPDTLRKQICQALAPRTTVLTVAAILVRALARAGSNLGELSGQCLMRIMRSASRNEYAEDEMELLVFVLTGFLSLPSLGEADSRLRAQLTSLITSQRMHVDSRTRERLRFIRKDLPEHLASRLDWA